MRLKPVTTWVSDRTRASEQDVRALIALAFLAMSIYLLASTVRRCLRYDTLNPTD
jgi:hypothetical protein